MKVKDVVKKKMFKTKLALKALGVGVSSMMLSASVGLTALAYGGEGGSFLADVTEDTVKNNMKTGMTSIQAVLTALVAIVGVVACFKVIIPKLPNLDDPHAKKEMWGAVGNILLAVGGAAALVWVVPYIWGLFYN